MLHPLLSVVVSRPDLVAEHAASYAALVREESESLATRWVHRGVACAVALTSVAVTLILTGMAVMLGTVNNTFHWSLVIVPVVALLPALWGWQVARKPAAADAFETLAEQFQADVRALRAAGDKKNER